jgi:hypothetical protein
MGKTSYYGFCFLALLLVLSDSMKAFGRAILASETALTLQERMGTVLDETGEVSNWLAGLNGGEGEL